MPFFSFRGKLQQKKQRLSVIFQVFFVLDSVLNFGGENSSLALVVPLFDPVDGADVSEDMVEVLARLVVLSLHLLAAVKVDIVLPAVPGLILVGKSGIEGCEDVIGLAEKFLGLLFLLQGDISLVDGHGEQLKKVSEPENKTD